MPPSIGLPKKRRATMRLMVFPTDKIPKFDSFGDRLAWWIKARNYARFGDFAKEVGIAQPSLSELMTGQSKQPAADKFLKMADLLNLRPRYLLTGEGPAEGQYFQDLSGPEAQLVMIFRQLPTDALRDALLIDAHHMLARNPPKPETRASDPQKAADVYQRLKTKPVSRKTAKKRAA